MQKPRQQSTTFTMLLNQAEAYILQLNLALLCERSTIVSEPLNEILVSNLPDSV